MAKSVKLDLFKQHKAEYILAKKPTVVEVGPAKYLVFAGRSRPGGQRFMAGMGALFGVAYTIKFAGKADGRDFKVCPPEGRYWLGDPDQPIGGDTPMEQMDWQLMIRVPDFVAARTLAAAKKQLADKGKEPETQEVRLLTLREGRCVQLLHVGPYEAETESIERMKQFAATCGLALRGPHHEIYFSDPRRVPAATLRTLLRFRTRKKR